MHACSLWGLLLASSPRACRNLSFPSFSFHGRVLGLSFTRCFCIVFSAKTGNFVIFSAAWKQILRNTFGPNIYEIVKVEYNLRLQIFVFVIARILADQPIPHGIPEDSDLRPSLWENASHMEWIAFSVPIFWSFVERRTLMKFEMNSKARHWWNSGFEIMNECIECAAKRTAFMCRPVREWGGGVFSDGVYSSFAATFLFKAK